MHTTNATVSVCANMHEDQPGSAYLAEQGLEFTPDGKFVRWQGQNKKHPRNWHIARKIYDTSLFCALDMIVTILSIVGAATGAQAKDEYHVAEELTIFIFVTLFLLGSVLGTLVFPPLSESFGRKHLYVVSSILSAVCCVITGVIDSLAAVIVGRFMAGVLSGVPFTVVGGSIEDMWGIRPRVWVIFLWAVVCNVGMSIGPITGTYITAVLGWRWAYYIYAMIMALFAILLCFTRESRPSTLLVREVNRVRTELGDDSLEALNHDHAPDFRTFAKVALFRPAQLLVTEFLVCTIALMIAYVFSLFYMFTEALQPIYQGMGFTLAQASLPFLAIGIGVLCLSALTRILDHRSINARQASGQPIKPEDKLTGLAIGGFVLAIGLWWFAWTIPPQIHDVHWMAPTASLVFVGYAINELNAVLLGYLGDSYLSYSASAMAAVQLIRTLLSSVAPLFTRQMFDGLGNNVAMSVLAALATVFSILPLVFIFYGERIRQNSKFAKHSLDVQASLGKENEA